MRTRARSRLGSLFVERDLAVVDPLLVHPFPAEPLFSRERIDHIRRCLRIGRPLILSEAMWRTEDREGQSEGRAVYGWSFDSILGAAQDHPLRT
jgi:hypothetical protein